MKKFIFLFSFFIILSSLLTVSAQSPTIVIGNGDANGDGVVNSKDLLAVFQNYNKSLGLPTDQYGDGLVNMVDLGVVINSILNPSPTPTNIPTPTGPTPTPGPVGSDWSMAAANPQRTSHNSVEVSGNLSVEWYRPFGPYIDQKTQVIATNGQIFVSTSKGLYAINASTGTQQWVFGTDMPLGNAPTIATVNGKLVAYVGGMDHRLYAVDVAASNTAGSGVLLAGFTPYEAGVGYETNPLVINDSFTSNQPVVFIGNRDSNFYAFNATTGAKIWSYTTGGPIRFSAAYKNGVVYFGADDNVAYALNVTDGSLKWKTPTPGTTGALPGVGFSTYWPVIYNNPGDGKDYVMFSGSKKATWLWFEDTNYSVNYNYETYSDPNNMFNGNNGCSLVSGNTYNCAIISNYFANKKDQRHFFVFDASTGSEMSNPYPPVNWAGVTRGGNKFPPIVSGDNKVYTFIGFNNAGPNSTTGTQGWISGWNFGTTQTTRIYNPSSGAGDEPVAFTSGGNLIYWGEGINADTFGTVDITKPVGSNRYTWDPRSVSSIDLSSLFGGANGVYSYLDGTGNFSPIPYSGRLYIIVGNTLVALSSNGGARNAGTSAVPSSQQTQPISITTSDLQTKLGTEIQKIISAGHLRPGFMDSGILAGDMDDHHDGNILPGNQLEQYFTAPGQTLATLASAMPYLSASLQSQLKTYLQTEETNYPVETITDIGWRNGAKREIYDDTSEITAYLTWSDSVNYPTATTPRNYYRNYNNLAVIPVNNSNVLLPDAFYGAWKYAVAEGFTAAQAKALFDKMSGKLPVAGTNNDMTNANLITYPYILNEYIDGYRGYVELEKLSGYTTDISQSSKYAEYTRLVNLRINNFSEASNFGTGWDYNHAMNVSRNFMYMTPELAAILRTNKLSAVQTAINDYQVLEPYWFVSKYDRTYGEAVFQPLYDHAALFQAMAYVLQQPQSTLVKYLDEPAFYQGDLFYIQNLVAALQAPQ